MGTTLHWLVAYWWLAGLAMSVLWGLLSGALFPGIVHRRWTYFYQFTANFVGSLAGWCCVYALAVRATAAPDLRSLNGGDALLFLFSLLGVTGHLTQALVGLVNAIEVLGTIAKKVS